MHGGSSSGRGDESLRFKFFGGGGEGDDLTATGAGSEVLEHMIALMRWERVLGEGAEQLGVKMSAGGMGAVLGGCGHDSACSENV
jgi:hypothetical protein